MVAEFDLTSGRARGEVVKVNPLTIWVRMPNGRIIKRRIARHNVVFLREEDGK